MPRPRGSRTLVWVQPSVSMADIKYGFSTNMDAADQGALFQTPVVRGTLLAGLVIGANNIKPPRASKRKAVGTSNSFFSADEIAAVKAAGWKTTPGKIRGRISTTRSTAVYATINGVKVGFQLPPLNVAGRTFADFGLTEVTATDTDVFYGCSLPRPGKAVTILDTGATVSTVYDPSATLPAQWAASGSPVLIPG